MMLVVSSSAFVGTVGYINIAVSRVSIKVGSVWRSMTSSCSDECHSPIVGEICATYSWMDDDGWDTYAVFLNGSTLIAHVGMSSEYGFDLRFTVGAAHS